MGEKEKLTPERIEELAKEIREFLLDHDMWIDVTIYFNGSASPRSTERTTSITTTTGSI